MRARKSPMVGVLVIPVLLFPVALAADPLPEPQQLLANAQTKLQLHSLKTLLTKLESQQRGSKAAQAAPPSAALLPLPAPASTQPTLQTGQSTVPAPVPLTPTLAPGGHIARPDQPAFDPSKTAREAYPVASAGPKEASNAEPPPKPATQSNPSIVKQVPAEQPGLDSPKTAREAHPVVPAGPKEASNAEPPPKPAAQSNPSIVKQVPVDQPGVDPSKTAREAHPVVSAGPKEASNAESPPEPAVQSKPNSVKQKSAALEQGLQIEFTDYGLYTVDRDISGRDSLGINKAAASNIRHAATSRTIPAQIGTTFGFQFRIVGRPSEAPIDLTGVVKFPSPGMIVPSSAKPVAQDQFPLQARIGEPVYFAYTIEDSFELLPGTWTMEIWHRDQKLGTQAFRLAN